MVMPIVIIDREKQISVGYSLNCQGQEILPYGSGQTSCNAGLFPDKLQTLPD